MSDDHEHPSSNATRGGGEWSNPYPRCVDCPQFTVLSDRMATQEVTLRDVNQRLHTVERNQDAHGRKLERLDSSVSQVVRWLDGTNGADGFKVEWALVKQGLKTRERITWLLGGGLSVMLIRLAWGIAADAIQRGVTP